MSGSSDIPISEFEGVRQRQVWVLVDVLRKAELTTVAHVRRWYNDNASRFDETFAFLASIGGVAERGGLLCLHPVLAEIEAEDEAALSHAILKLIFQAGGPYQREAREYIGRFRVEQGIVAYRSSEEVRSAESGVRNYLIDLGMVTYDSATRRYVIPPQHISLYAAAVRPDLGVTPSQLRSQLRAREEIGLRAEERVLAYERERVGERFRDRIQHVAARDVAAGYDVLSITLDSDENILPRYIEVKAVPRTTWRFYLTANELAMAKLMPLWYYLYLVPIGTDGTVDISAMRILVDPWSSVLGAGSEWSVETNIVRCSLESVSGRE